MVQLTSFKRVSSPFPSTKKERKQQHDISVFYKEKQQNCSFKFKAQVVYLGRANFTKVALCANFVTFTNIK